MVKAWTECTYSPAKKTTSKAAKDAQKLSAPKNTTQKQKPNKSKPKQLQSKHCRLRATQRRTKNITKVLKKIDRGLTDIAMTLLASTEKKERNRRLQKKMKNYL